MPELPEVETTCRGIRPHLLDQTIEKVVVRNRNLRWPVPAGIGSKLSAKKITAVRRRGKYILLETQAGTLLVHLGMTGSLRILQQDSEVQKHDHLDLILDNGHVLRFRDPRRFGSVLWGGNNPLQHKLLRALGPEPLSNSFDGDHLFLRSRNRKQSVKTFIMDSHNVVGVGNIYASEALFKSGIHPRRAAGRISTKRYVHLAEAIKSTLQDAINSGGTTLRDFVNSEGEPGYFSQHLLVYGRDRELCYNCKEGNIRLVVLGQRSSYYCPKCQR